MYSLSRVQYGSPDLSGGMKLQRYSKLGTFIVFVPLPRLGLSELSRVPSATYMILFWDGNIVLTTSFKEGGKY